MHRCGSKPFGDSVVLNNLDKQIAKLTTAILWASEIGEMKRDGLANKRWKEVYPALAAEIPGNFGAAIGRAEGQVLRVAMLLALLDLSPVIQLKHLEAALSLWQYCLDSARYLFLSKLEDSNAYQILLSLRERRPEGMTRSEISNLFGRHLSQARIEEALRYLEDLELAVRGHQSTQGRPIERWTATVKEKTEP